MQRGNEHQQHGVESRRCFIILPRTRLRLGTHSLRYRLRYAGKGRKKKKSLLLLRRPSTNEICFCERRVRTFQATRILKPRQSYEQSVCLMREWNLPSKSCCDLRDSRPLMMSSYHQGIRGVREGPKNEVVSLTRRWRHKYGNLCPISDPTVGTWQPCPH